MDVIPGPLIYEIAKFLKVGNLMLFEIMSQKIRDKLYKNTSGVNYLLRKKNFLEVRHFTESKRFFKHMAAPTMIRPKYGDNLLSIYD